MTIRKTCSVLALFCSVLLAVVAIPGQAEIDVQVRGDNERTSIKRVTAQIIEIDAGSREITLDGELGNRITITAGPEITRFDEFAVGDLVVATFMSSLSGELRAPTEEELAVPIVEVEGEAVAGLDMMPGATVGRVVRAVCTIEGMNRATRTVMLMDPDGDFHLLADVDPAKMAGVALGDTVIVTYSEALALTLEAIPAAVSAPADGS